MLPLDTRPMISFKAKFQQILLYDITANRGIPKKLLTTKRLWFADYLIFRVNSLFDCYYLIKQELLIDNILVKKIKEMCFEEPKFISTK